MCRVVRMTNEAYRKMLDDRGYALVGSLCEGCSTVITDQSRSEDSKLCKRCHYLKEHPNAVGIRA